MSGFIRQGQTELTILLFCALVGAAVGIPRAGLKGLLVGAVAGPVVVVLVVLGLFGAAWLGMKVKALFSPSQEKTTEEDSGAT